MCNSLSYLIKHSFYEEELNDYAKGWSYGHGERTPNITTECCSGFVLGIIPPPRDICCCPRNLLAVTIWKQCQWGLVGIGQGSQKSPQYIGHLMPKSCPAPVFMVGHPGRRGRIEWLLSVVSLEGSRITWGGWPMAFL